MLDYSNIEFPISVKQYNKIEKLKNVNINILVYEEIQAFPVYASKEKSSIMYSSKISTCPFITKQNITIENTIACTVCNVSAVKRYLQTQN